jgi:3-methyladenine DNA glycosylase AlkD
MPTAERFIQQLNAHQSPEELQKIQRYFKSDDGFMGVRMGDVFNLAKQFIDMPLDEIETLLESQIHEVRAGAVSIMEKQSRHKKTPESRKKELYDLYLRRHDRINNWDLVDLGARYVIGGYLFDKPREVLYELARSENQWERRTAIVATLYFVMRGDLDDAFHIAEMLIHDEQDLVNKATGWTLRAAGDQDRQRLLKLLDQYAATIPRTLLRYSIEHFDKDQRDYYLGLKAKR